jgi:hypothetical protein
MMSLQLLLFHICPERYRSNTEIALETVQVGDGIKRKERHRSFCYRGMR